VLYANKGEVLMEQNINFLSTLNIQAMPSFSAKLIMQIIGSWVLLLIFIYTIPFITHASKQKTLVGLESTQKTLQIQIENLNTELNSTDETRVLPFIPGNLTGFYNYLEDLASFIPDNIWLDNIVFSQPDNLILLKGNATSASIIPTFIDALEKSEAFNDKKFGTLQLQKTPDSSNVSFTLSTGIAIESK